MRELQVAGVPCEVNLARSFPIHHALEEQFRRVPREALASVISDKVSAAGLDTTQADRIAGELLAGAAKVAVDHESDDDPQIELTAEDVRLATERSSKAIESLPTIINQAVDDTAPRIVRSLRAAWATRGWEVEAELAGFRARLYERWGEALDGLRLLLQLSREAGEDEYRRLGRSRAKKNRLVQSVLLRLHARCCQVASECLTLMEAGYPDGAFARWRSLHELVLVGTLVQTHGDDLARRYVDHEFVEAKTAMDQYVANYEKLGYAPPDQREVDRIGKQYEALLVKYGKSFRHPYGWAAHHLGNDKPTFVDIQAAANRAEMRGHYKMASYGVHAGVKSITWTLGTLDGRDAILAGVTNAGLEEPGQNVTASLVAANTLLLSDNPKIDDVIQMRVMLILRDRTVGSFLKAARKLLRDDRKFRRSTTTRQRPKG